jgi:hypothetical protein
MQFVGSITPQGEIQMTFTFTPPPDVDPALGPKVAGSGTMRLARGEWQPEMQMTTGVSSLVTHSSRLPTGSPPEHTNKCPSAGGVK